MYRSLEDTDIHTSVLVPEAIHEDDGVPEYHAKQGTSSTKRVVLNLVNAITGCGLISLPFALKEAGFALGIGMFLFMVLLTQYSLQLLVKTGIAEGVRNYEELVESLFGFYGYIGILFLLFLYDFGAMCVFLILLGDMSSDIARDIASRCFELAAAEQDWLTDPWTLRRCTILAICLFVILPICLFRDLSRLEKFSFVSVLATTAVVVVCLITAIQTGLDKNHGSEEPWLTLVGESPSTAFGIIAFVFVSHDSCFLLYGTLGNPTKSRWDKVTKVSLGISLALCLAFAIPGYVTFRDNTEQNLLRNYRPDDIVVTIVRILYLVTICLTYPFSFFISRHIMNELIHRVQNRHKYRKLGTPSGPAVQLVDCTRHVTLTLFLFFASVLVVMFVNKPGIAMSLTGNICALGVAFIVPPACAIRSRLNARQRFIDDPSGVALLRNDQESPQYYPVETNYEKWSILRPILLLLFGCFSTIFCTIRTVARLSED